MKKLSKKVIIGTVIGALAISGTAFGAIKAYEKNIKARFANIKLIVDGKTIQTKAEPFIYNGNVYAPVATIANGMGIGQKWNNATPSVEFTKSTGNTIEARNNYIKGMDYQQYQGEMKSSTNLFLDVYLQSNYRAEGENNLVTYSVIDTSNSKGGLISTIAPDGSKLVEQQLIRSSISSYLNNGSFAFFERSGNGKSWVTFYKYENGKLTKGESTLLNSDSSIFVTVHDDLVTYVKNEKIYKIMKCSYGGEKFLLHNNVLGTTTTPDIAK